MQLSKQDGFDASLKGKSGGVLDMTNFLDTTNIDGRFDYSEWVRAFGRYLQETLDVWRNLSFFAVRLLATKIALNLNSAGLQTLSRHTQFAVLGQCLVTGRCSEQHFGHKEYPHEWHGFCIYHFSYQLLLALWRYPSAFMLLVTVFCRRVMQGDRREFDLINSESATSLMGWSSAWMTSAT